MQTELTITFVILAAALILFLTDKLPADLVALLVVVALGVTGVLTPAEAFSGFSRSAVITIIAIFVLTEGLQRTGVTDQVGNVLLKIGGKGEKRLVVTVMITGAFLSLFMNNIAAAAVLLPAVSGAARKVSVSKSRLLMPLAFATILGGTATLLTTTNIILNSLLHDNDFDGYRITDFMPVGLIVVAAGIAYITLIGRKLLPSGDQIDRTQAPNVGSAGDLVEAYGLGRSLFRARLPENSSLIGKTLAESHLREEYDVSVVAIERDEKRIFALSPETTIRSRDILVMEGDEDEFRRRDVQPYVEFLPTSDWKESDLESQIVEVVEAMIAPRSRLIGKTLREAHFREKYGMSALAIWRGEEEIYFELADIPLEFGDALLLQGTRDRLNVLADDPDLILLVSKGETAITVPNKGLAAILIFAATLAFAIAFPDLTGPIMLGGGLAMMLTGIISTEQAYASIGWKSVFLVAGMLPMGIALTKTNAAGLIAAEFQNLLAGYAPLVMLGGMMLFAIVFTQAINGAVAAAVIGPIAIQVAQQTGTNPRSMVMGIALACSMAFITPLGHAVNILVMSPGGYKFRDYVKVGLPMTVMLFIVVMIVLPIFWPL
jgi:di/tricarboxylate transporter